MVMAAFREKKSQRKPVICLSTAHNACMQETQVRKKNVLKPTMILAYNKYMGGVDISDKMVCHYASERPTRRYWKKIFQNLIDISLLNAYHLHTMNVGPMPRRRFMQDVVEALCAPGAIGLPAVLPARPPAAAAVTHHLQLLDGKKEKDCFVCSDRDKNKGSSAGRKRSRHWCPACKVGCHERCEPLLVHRTDQGLQRRKRARQE